jgi:glycosyltransferase involved in cell wall biosynthesis
LRIAFTPMGGERWMAGEVIVRNILLSVRELNPPALNLAIIGDGPTIEPRLRQKYQAADDFIPYTRPSRFRAGWIADQVSRRVTSKHPSLEKVLKRHQVDVLFGSCLTLRYPSVATLSWMPDFQHRRMPEMFSAEERADRDKTFALTARVSSRIILLSRAVQDDFRVHLPAYAAKTRVLSPITRVPAWVYHDDPGEVLRRYHLPEKFFYLPNQFWKHKNHEAMFRAVKDLKDRGTTITVVCTGFPSDYRATNTFSILWEQLSRWNIRDQIIYLGLVPYDDVLRLHRQAICVVNPSRFEGWGISIDEARSIGKRVIASDLPSHREQSPPSALYFDPADEGQLAPLVEEVWKTAAPGPDRELEAQARIDLPRRLQAYAQDFLAVSREALSEKGGHQ